MATRKRWGVAGLLGVHIVPIMENPMEKNMENKMETRGLQGCIGIQIAQCGSYLPTLGPSVGSACILGCLGFWPGQVSDLCRSLRPCIAF